MLRNPMSQTKSPDDSQSIANFIPFFGYTETNLDFARNRSLAFTGKSPKSPFCP